MTAFVIETSGGRAIGLATSEQSPLPAPMIATATFAIAHQPAADARDAGSSSLV